MQLAALYTRQEMLKQRVEQEADYNRRQIENRAVDTIPFGQEVVLIHYISRQILGVSKEYSKNEKSNLKI